MNNDEDVFYYNKNLSDEREKLSVLSRVVAFLGVLGFPVMFISGMVFDAPGSENSIQAKVIFYILFSFSPICFLSILISDTLYKFGLNKLSLKIIKIPFAIIISVICFVVYAFIETFIFQKYILKYF